MRAEVVRGRDRSGLWRQHGRCRVPRGGRHGLGAAAHRCAREFVSVREGLFQPLRWDPRLEGRPRSNFAGTSKRRGLGQTKASWGNEGVLGKRRRSRAGLAGPRSRIPRLSSRPRADLVTTERGPPSVGALARPLPGQAHAAASRSQRSGPRWSWTALAVSAARLAPANLHTLAWLPRA